MLFNARVFYSPQVNNNGLITFDAQLNEYKPQDFPLKENTPLIAPFWADVDVSPEWSIGNVWYRQDQSSSLLSKASEEIREYFISQRNFQANWLFIATWHKVGYYAAVGSGRSKVRGSCSNPVKNVTLPKTKVFVETFISSRPSKQKKVS